MPPAKKRHRKATSLDIPIWFYFSEAPQLELAYYASGFLEAARSLVRRLRRIRGFRNIDPLPVLFLYRHAIELFMKSIITRGHLMTSESDDPLAEPSFLKKISNHRLLQLLPGVEATFDQVGWEWAWPISPIVGTMANVQALVAFLERLDPLSTSFRYPVDKKGKRLIPYDVEIQLGSVVNALDALAEALEIADSAIEGFPDW